MCWTWNPQTRDGAQWHLTRDDAERFCLQNPPHVIYSSRCDPFHQPPFPEQVGAPPPPPIAMAVEPGLRRSRRNTAAAAVPAAAVPAGGLLPTHLAAGLTLPDTHAPAAGGKLEQGAETGMAVLRALVNSAGGLPTPVRLACTHNDASVDFLLFQEQSCNRQHDVLEWLECPGAYQTARGIETKSRNLTANSSVAFQFEPHQWQAVLEVSPISVSLLNEIKF